MGVAVGAFDLEHALTKSEYRDIEGAATEVVNRDGPLAFLVEAVGECGCGRLIDYSEHLKARHLPCDFRCFALAVIEVGRDCDNGLLDLLTQLCFGVFLQLAKHHGRDFRRRACLAVKDDPGITTVQGSEFERHVVDIVFNRCVIESAAYEPFGRVDRVFGVRNRLATCEFSDKTFVGLCVEGHDRRRGASALCVFDDLGLARFHDRHCGVRSSQVDSNNLCHCYFRFPFLIP